MNAQDRQLMQQAREALGYWAVRDEFHKQTSETITALDKRLIESVAQPEQQKIEQCVWARNGNTPCPHVQPALNPEQEPLTDKQATKAALWDLAVSEGLITVHSEQLAPGTWSANLSVASWMEGHDKACDIINKAAHGITSGAATLGEEK